MAENLMSAESNFLIRTEIADFCGRIVKANGRWVAIPPYHRRPNEPFYSGAWRYGRLPVKRRFEDGKK